MSNKHLIILGTRGIPAEHGGFETFAEHLAIYLNNKGWDVTIYCQIEGTGPLYIDSWRGIKRINIPVNKNGPIGTIIFDYKSIRHSLNLKGVFLTLGYNTAFFNLAHRFKSKKNLINMDGIEWRRRKWGLFAKFWFWANEVFACRVGNHLIADNPHIAKHLKTMVSTSKISMIPYGGVHDAIPNINYLSDLGLEKRQYATVIARGEPENSILEIVESFSARKRGIKLLVIGNYTIKSNSYQQSVVNAASDEVIFPGVIYKPEAIYSLRYYSLFYIHGHQVGGTNPSLVEALAAENAIIAYDNPFNRWVAADSAIYFTDTTALKTAIEKLITNKNANKRFQENAKKRFSEAFTWENILAQYEQLLQKWLPGESLDNYDNS